MFFYTKVKYREIYRYPAIENLFHFTHLQWYDIRQLRFLKQFLNQNLKIKIEIDSKSYIWT